MGALELMTHFSCKTVRVYGQTHPLRAKALEGIKEVLREKQVADKRLARVDSLLTSPQLFGINVCDPPELVDYFALHAPDLSMTSINVLLQPDFRLGPMVKLILENLGYRSTDDALRSPESIFGQKLAEFAARKGPVALALFLERRASTNKELTAFCVLVRTLGGSGSFKAGLYVPTGESEFYEKEGSPCGVFLGQLQTSLSGYYV
jgi:hypothetical protein